MRIQFSEAEDLKLNMTAMIDIVFQLLVFFILTFKVVVMEGDFKIKMPLVTDAPQTMTEDMADMIPIRLQAGVNGNIASIIVDDNVSLSDPTMYQDLTKLIEERLASEGNLESESETSVEFDIDYSLKYSFTVKAIDAVSGRKGPDGVKKLIKKIQFKDNKKNG